MLQDQMGHGLMVPKLMSDVVDLISLVTEHFKNTKNWGGANFLISLDISQKSSGYLLVPGTLLL